MLLVCATALGCSASVEEPALSPSKPRATPDEPAIPKGSLGRRDVVAVVDAGLGVFLQQIQVEPSLKDGKFEGFRVLSLQPENFWTSVDLRPGDVVVGVNGKSIEEPVAAYDIFESLRTASELRVHVLREGHARELVFPIVGAPQPKPESGKPAATAGAPAASSG